MGVTGLWPILAPTARPTPLPTLNRKRLAVDASIWIYQFLKAVRDKEGNALRNSHVVGFFRRICKLLFFGIKPVFVFDGGAPVLKRQTVMGRKERREGRREDAARTAGRLLAVQMRKRGEEEEGKRKRAREMGRDGREEGEQEEVPDEGEMVYVGEVGMSAQERQTNRTFRKKDAYHLPDIPDLAAMGQPNDPRIMSAEQLEEYARQFSDGEDVNMYDFSKIDFNGEFFLSLPPGDRYNILNAARLRSRLRMGLSKEQLEEMFPDRMEFSRFQIERVRERNELTQRLMNLNGMNDGDGLPGVGGGRIAGESGREYVLVKNDGVEGGWALGVVSTDKSVGERNKPIDIDALHQKVKIQESESEEEFEDVPVEGLNRLPKLKDANGREITYDEVQARKMAQQRRNVYSSRTGPAREQGESSRAAQVPSEELGLFVEDDDDGLFVGNDQDDESEDLNRAIAMSMQQTHASPSPEIVDDDDEEAHLNKAIALSLQTNHHQPSASENEDEDMEFEDVPMPEYQQTAVAPSKPLVKAGGSMIAHIVNNRSNAAVPKRRESVSSGSGSDSDMDMQAALAKARRQKAKGKAVEKPVPNVRNPFDGPLPFEKLDFKSSLFKKAAAPNSKSGAAGNEIEDDEAGGFMIRDEDVAKPLPPWLAGGSDIREKVREQDRMDKETNAEDKARADEDERVFRRENGPIEILSEDEGGSDVEILDAPPPTKPRRNSDIQILDAPPMPKPGEVIASEEIVDATIIKKTVSGDGDENVRTMDDLAEIVSVQPPISDIPNFRQPSVERVQENHPAATDDDNDEEVDWSESEHGGDAANAKPLASSKSKSASPEFEDVPLPESNTTRAKSPPPFFPDLNVPEQSPLKAVDRSMFTAEEQAEIDAEFDEFSDPEDEELLAQLAIEAEEHARFASTLNNKSERENQEAYEKELKALRTQQKKDRRDADEVSHVMITECQALLRLFGIPYITAPMEAEAQCAELVRLGLVDGIVTDDSDIFLFGGTRVYKNMFNSNKFVECYLASDLEKELSLSRDQLISIAHLLGSDYTEGLAGVGPVTAVEILSEFPSPSTGLEEFRDWWKEAQLSSAPLSSEISTFRKKFRRAQATKLILPLGFPSPAVTEAYLKPEVDSTPEAFQWGVPDLERLREFLMATIGWNQERTDEVLVPVIRDMNRREAEGTQANITRFFEGAVGTGVNTNKAVGKGGGSKRMNAAVSKLREKKKGGVGGGVEERGTFGDAAKEWMEKEKKNERKEKAKAKAKRAAEVLDAEGSTGDDDDDDDGAVGGSIVGKGKGKGNGKAPAKRKRTKA